MLSKGAGHYRLPRTVMTAVPAAKTRVAHSAAPRSFEGRAVHTNGVVHPAVSGTSVISKYAIGQAHANAPPSTAADSRPRPPSRRRCGMPPGRRRSGHRPWPPLTGRSSAQTGSTYAAAFDGMALPARGRTKYPAAWFAAWSTPPPCDGSCETRRYMPRFPGLGGGADSQVNPLVVKAHQVRDAAGVGNRRLVTPHDILMDVVAHLDRPVGRLAFERAGRRVS